MGRELKRVPLDFDCPIDETWIGFLNPHYKHSRDCPFCEGSAFNPETRQIADDWYDFENTGARWCDNITQDEVDALVEGGRLCEWRGQDNGGYVKVPRTAAEVNAANARGSGLFGELCHDAINRWICVETRAKRLGVYGHCAYCDEDGTLWRTPEDKAACEAWEPTPPPEGDGYQLWQTVSEGGPISPVFATPEELARHMTTTRWGADGGTSYETWLALIRGPGWAPSLMSSGGRVVSGVEAVTGGLDHGGTS